MPQSIRGKIHGFAHAPLVFPLSARRGFGESAAGG